MSLFIDFSSQGDVKDFLLTLNLNRDNYQLGSTKIFMRECEKVKLDYRLHQQIIASIVKIQRWFRTILERARFLRLRSSAVAIQVQIESNHIFDTIKSCLIIYYQIICIPFICCALILQVDYLQTSVTETSRIFIIPLGVN